MSQSTVDRAAASGESPVPAERSAQTAWIVLAVTFLCSTLLGVFFFAQYSAVLTYVRTTLEEPERPHAWETRIFTPEECIDAAIAWTGECRGIKTMCDMYVDQVMVLCMESQPRVAYCEALGDRTMTTAFGAEECFARGTRRNVDAEACSAAYRFIDGFCDTILEALEAPGEPSAANAEAAPPGVAGGTE